MSLPILNKMFRKIKKVSRPLIEKALSRESILRRARNRLLQNKAIVLMYHEIAEDISEVEAWTVVKKSEFVKQMEYLLQNFQIVDLKEALRKMEAKDDLDQPLAVITFDDGYSGNKQVLLPILESLKIPTTIFVSTQAVRDQELYWYDRIISALQGDRQIDLKHPWLGEYQFNGRKGAVNWSEIERLLTALKNLKPNTRKAVVDDILKEIKPSDKKGVYSLKPMSIDDLGEMAKSPLITIGAHSHCHSILTQLSEDELRKTIKESKRLLESWTGYPVTCFAYPNGNYNDQVIRTIKEEGFECGLTTVAQPWRRRGSLYTIPRIGVGRYDSLDFFKISVSGGLDGFQNLRTGLKKVLHLNGV